MIESVFSAIDKNKTMLFEAERQIWNNPESGYREWKTHNYLKEKYEKLGYTVHEAGNIPGFYIDIDTGISGPKVAIFGEMDSLIIPSHPECDKETGAVHACGHNCQSAALLGVAAAFADKKCLEGLCGSIRLIIVPAEEAIELDYRKKLIDEGVIKYFSGKLEFMYRGFLNDVDIAYMIHTSGNINNSLNCLSGHNGAIIKTAVFKGVTSHAGGSPHHGKNALYAATNAIATANSLRETFKDEDHIRFHPIITNGGESVNAIPDCVTVESYVRGASFDAMHSANEKINRAFAAAAAGMDCELTICDCHGYSPTHYDKNLKDVFNNVAKNIFPEDEINMYDPFWSRGSTDICDVGCVIPVIHPHIKGAFGAGHTAEYLITDPENAVINDAKIEAGVAYDLLKNNAVLAKNVIKNKNVPFDSIEEFLKAIDKENVTFKAVTHNDDGTLTLRFK